MENILVIGNGFDIAHGFNTRYEDFINFCKTIATVYQGFKDNQFIYQNEYNDILKEKLNYDGISLAENNGLGQEVKHFHLHLIPRYNNEKKIPVEEIYNILK